MKSRSDDLDDILSKLKPAIGEKKADALWFAYHLDSYNRDFIESLAHVMSARYLDETFESKSILLGPPPAEDANGEYPLGAVFYGEKPQHLFGLREEEWIHHVAIFGRSGSGKTMIAFIILANFLAKEKPFLVFDWKRNYRDLLSHYPEILIFTIGRDISGFSWNPLIPPQGVSPTTWIRKLVEVLCHAYFLGEGVTYLLLKAIDAVFRERGVYEESAREYPTFRDVFDWINRYKAIGREGQWLDSTKRTLAVLCFGEFGRSLNVKRSASISELLKANAVMELDALSNSDKMFFIEALLLWIHHFRMGQPARETFKHAILIEEAHHILLRKKQELHGEETITDVILREIRELGESIILIDQHPSLISKPAIGNTYTTITMNLKHGDDIATLADSLLLEYNQREYLGTLPIGSGIVKLQGRWFKPFLVKFPAFPLKKGMVTDENIRTRMQGYLGLFAQTGQGDVFSGDVREILGRAKIEEEKRAEGLDRTEIAFLQDAMVHPYSGMVERYRRLGLNSYQGNKIKNELVAKGLAQESEISTTKGRIKIIRPTKKGRRMIGAADEDGSTGHGQPGLEHEYWKHALAEHFRTKGYTVEIEKPLGEGKAADLSATKDGERVAIEIETGKSDAIYNIQKCIEAGFDKVISFATNPEARQKIDEELGAAGLRGINRVKVASPTDFYQD